MKEIKPFLTVKDIVHWYYYLLIQGGTGKKDGHGGQHRFYLTYLRPDQRTELSEVALDYWCKERKIPCGIGDTIELAHADFQKKLKKLPLN